MKTPKQIHELINEIEGLLDRFSVLSERANNGEIDLQLSLIEVARVGSIILYLQQILGVLHWIVETPHLNEIPAEDREHGYCTLEEFVLSAGQSIDRMNEKSVKTKGKTR